MLLLADVKPGDYLKPYPAWNRSERPPHHLYDPTHVRALRTDWACQSGVMFQVRLRNGKLVWLDAGWFVCLDDADESK